MDKDHTVAIMDVIKWKNGETHSKPGQDPPCVVSKGKGPSDKIMHMVWNRYDDRLIIATNRDVYFVDVSREKPKPEVRKGTGWNLKEKCSSLCVGWVGDDMVSGSINGHLVWWQGNVCKKSTVGAHKGAIYCLRSGIQTLISGGADGVVNFWNSAGEKTNSIDCSKIIHSELCKIRAISKHPKEDKIMIGTRGGEIVELNLGNPAEKPLFIVRGHYD